MATHRITGFGPGFTVIEPSPDFDPFAAHRPWLDALSPSDRERALIDLALCPTERARDATADWYRAMIETEYVEAEGGGR